ncbi:MAG: YdcF family protein [Hyphomicrobiales bacterium]
MTDSINQHGSGQQNAQAKPKRSRPHAASRLALTAVAGALAVWLMVAFAGFVGSVNALSVPAPARADGIVVVTGGSARIEVALQLLADGAAERLLISGVHDSTDAATLVRRTRSDPSLFDCCVDLDHAAMDTAGNARESANWAREHDFQSLLVVTSAYHVPRTTREMAQLLPGVELIAFPIDPGTGDHRAAGSQSSSWSIALLAREFAKLQLTRIRHLVGGLWA